MATKLSSGAPAREAELATAPDDAPAVKTSKSVTMDAPSQQEVHSLSEVQLANRKTTNRSTNMSRDAQISRPEGYVPIGQRPSVRLINSSHHITAEWLTEVYEDRGFLEKGGKVTSCNVKPLGVLWGLYPTHYTRANTIMLDDLSRNFLMNPPNNHKSPEFLMEVTDKTRADVKVRAPAFCRSRVFF